VGSRFVATLVLLLIADNTWCDVGGVLILRVVDLDEVWHDLSNVTLLDLGALHNLDFESDNTLSELDRSDSLIDEIVLWLTCGDLITLGVLLSLGTLSSYFTRDDNFATNGTSASHDSSKNVVGSQSNWCSAQKLVLQGLDIGSGAERLLIREWLDREFELVVSVVEVISLLDQRLDLLHFTGLLVEEVLTLGGTDTDLSAHAGSTNLNSCVSFESECGAKELIELSLENSISNELLLGVDLFNLLVSHRVSSVRLFY